VGPVRRGPLRQDKTTKCWWTKTTTNKNTTITAMTA
jgi:hypothetical protein